MYDYLEIAKHLHFHNSSQIALTLQIVSENWKKITCEN